MLFIIIIDNNRKTIKRFHHYLLKIIINVYTSKIIFKEQIRKKLSILEFINIYNHYINGIDNIDQLRYYYNTQRVYFKTWKSL